MSQQQKQAFDALRKKMNEAGILSLDTLFNATTKEEIARSAANNWCRCFKCDKIIRGSGYTCEKEKLQTCHQWYDAYRAALLALSDERIKELL